MPEYLSPGVYVEEIDAGPKPIEGVSTSTAAAVGVTARGPNEGAPRLVTSFAEFVRIFGGFLDEQPPALTNTWGAPDRGQWWTFPHAVKGFFDNGGQRLFIKRVVASGAQAANETIGRGLVVNVTRDAPATATTVTVDGLFNVGVGTNVGINGVAHAVTGYDASRRELSFGAAIGVDLRAGADRIVVHAPAAGAADETLSFRASSPGDWGNALSVRVRPMEGGSYALLPSSDAAVAGLPAATTISTATTVGSNVVDVADTAGFGANDQVIVGDRTYEVTALAAGAPGQLTLDRAPPSVLGVGTSVRRLRPAYDAGAGPTTTLRVWNASALYEGAIVELDNGTQKALTVVAGRTGDEVTFHSAIAIAAHETQRLRVIEARVEVRYQPGGQTEAEELFENLRLIDDQTASYLPRRINESSQLVRVDPVVLAPPPSNFPLADGTTDLARFPSTADGGWFALSSGGDNYGTLTVDDFVGVDGGAGRRTGVQALEEIDEISICTVPGLWSPLVHDALITHCETLLDRFAILDVQRGLDIQGVRATREAITSSYAALYYPWIEVRDPFLRRNVIAPPSGHLAGVYARTDVERGVHKAPANEVIRGITRIEQMVTKREQDLLNPRGINALRAFPGRGNLVWGARTIASDASWRYINVRRLFLFVEESIDEGTQWVVFEPNDERLWARVRQSITNFLTTVWRSGALFGSDVAEAFFVKCDRSTMSQDDIDNGRLICLIGIAPVKPAEFVIFRLQQKTIEAEA